MFSYFEPNFIENFFWESVFFFVFFQIFSKIKMTQNENRLFGRHFETISFFFYRIVIFYRTFINGASFIAKFRWEIGFRGGFNETILGSNGSESTLVT